METCVLIPQEFSLVVTAAGARGSGEQTVSAWTTTRIKQGALYYPFQGTVRIDKLNIYSYISEDDVSTNNQFSRRKKNTNNRQQHHIKIRANVSLALFARNEKENHNRIVVFIAVCHQRVQHRSISVDLFTRASEIYTHLECFLSLSAPSFIQCV